MKIVIDIPDAQYKYLAKIMIAGEEPLGYFERVIMRGTPLPKGHGDLIDRDALIYNADYYEPLISKRDVDFAPTIIEADKE